MESTFASTCTCWLGQECKKITVASVGALSLDRTAPTPGPPALSQNLVNLVPSHMSLALSELLPLCWMELRASECEQASMCRPLEKGVWSPQALHLTQTQSPPLSKVTCYRAPSPWHWCPRLGSLVWGWDPLLLKGGPPQLRHSSRFRIAVLCV
ncbi:hypothetical protein HJG60_010819 [Phyllostomus discolor]|uniref:Uncharacterized protein n=1 Tax=Phyllostomus discolor TaxID=89673 RepID=A0A834EAA6_9CHIR|nr:hypothetical protein HJG60_010819 [Phyllostomus discolor]